MNIINIEHISKIFGEKVIFEDASFGIQDCLSATESAFSEGGYGGFVCAKREWR